MMKKRLVVLITFALALSVQPLFSSLYRSNSLAQQLELLGSSQDSSEYRYLLEVTQIEGGGEEHILYDNEVVLQRIRMVGSKTKLGSRTTTEIYYAADGSVESEVKTIYENGLPQLIRRVNRGDDFVYLTHHTYNEGQLYETKELVDGELDRLVTYYRGDDGVLAGLRIVDLEGSINRSYFTTDSHRAVYGERESDIFSKLTFFPDNLIVQDLWLGNEAIVETKVSFDEVGRLVVDEIRQNVPARRVYSPDGLVVRLETVTADGSERTVRYQYDATGALDQTVEIIVGAQTTRVETWYRQDKLDTRTEWLNDIPVRSTRYVADGTSVVTLFEQGIPYADITYAPDGKRVLSLEYRKER